MKLPQLQPGILLKRYKRFLTDVKFSGQIITAHCPNSGSMKGVSEPGNQVMISLSNNPKRKLKYTLELIQVNGVWVGINTNLPNKLVKEGIEQKLIPELWGYQTIRTEVNYGLNSRVDLLLESPEKKCYVEVKNVTMKRNQIALFPDAVTERGQKHLKELMNVVHGGHRAVIFFVVQRGDCFQMAPANEIDPVYGDLLRQANNTGVEVLAYVTKINMEEIKLSHRIPVIL